MKVLLLPLLEGLLWFLRLLPRKPQPSQVRDTQAEEDEIWELMQPVQAPVVPAKDQSLFKPIAKTQVGKAKELLAFIHETEIKGASGWSHIATPRHQRDFDLVNKLKREGRL